MMGFSCRIEAFRERPMPVEIFLLIVCAALVHAAWNALVKADKDRLTLWRVILTTQFILSVLLLPFVPVPAPAAWPYLVGSALTNVGYVLFLTQAYRYGDLSHAYPLARGSAPLFVAAVSVLFLGEQLAPASQIAILLIGLGITSLSLTRGAEGLRDLRMVGYALGTGGFIATYTLLDGLGARASGSAHGFVVWVSLVGSAAIVAVILLVQRGRPVPSRRTRVAGIVSGLLAYGVAWAVIWAMTVVPVPLVSALRETSIVFAVAIGVVVFKERLNLARLASIASTLAGAALLKFSR
jgi:drug/metabolite transporter (DMT)-like permease